MRFRTRVPEDRRIVLELPTEVPVGELVIDISIVDFENAQTVTLPAEILPRSGMRSGIVREMTSSASLDSIAPSETTKGNNHEDPAIPIVNGADGRRRAFPLRPTHPKLAQEHDIFEQILPQLLEQYAGKYVALHEGKIVEVGNDYTAVLNSAYRKHPNIMHFVRLVTDQPQPLERVTRRREVHVESA